MLLELDAQADARVDVLRPLVAVGPAPVKFRRSTQPEPLVIWPAQYLKLLNRIPPKSGLKSGNRFDRSRVEQEDRPRTGEKTACSAGRNHDCGRRNRPRRHDRARVEQFLGTRTRRPKSAVRNSAHCCSGYRAARGHRGRQRGPLGLPLDSTYEPGFRLQLLHGGWRDMRTPFLVSAILDSIYQLITHRFIFPLELLFTATLLALVPSLVLVLRGPVNRPDKRFIIARDKA